MSVVTQYGYHWMTFIVIAFEFELKINSMIKLMQILFQSIVFFGEKFCLLFVVLYMYITSRVATCTDLACIVQICVQANFCVIFT